MTETSDDPLHREFLSPPDSAKPRVWWHWMNGNITKDGIKLDLEWMQRIGIGGLHNFDADYGTAQVVDQRLPFMTPPWKDAFRYTAVLADQLGLELAIAGSPGWSESGGPWVRSENAMKKVVWSETHVLGGTPFKGKLTHPPTVIGPFQNAPIHRSWSVHAPTAELVRELYADIGIIACKLPAGERSMEELNPVVTSNAGVIDAKRLWDGDFTHAVHVPYGAEDNPAWIQMDFGRPLTVHSMSIGLQQESWERHGLRHAAAVLEASTDGVRFRTVAAGYDTANQAIAGWPPLQETVTFAGVTARYFRLVLPAPRAAEISAAAAALAELRPRSKEREVTQLILHVTPRVHYFEQKAGYFLDTGLDPKATPPVSADEVLNRGDIIDLTSRVERDGTLDWTPPPGRWMILRVGYSLLGITNHPASPEGTGFEVDKLSRTAVKAHMDNYLALYETMLGSDLMGPRGLKAMINDSWEAGPQNWTPELPAEFGQRRGYNLIPWLPALTGRVIGSAEETDKFLWDFRRTLAELVAENHYGQLAQCLRERGMIHYGESHEFHRAFFGDGMDAKRENDIPMGAMWTPGFNIDQAMGDADLRESASVAHIYGQNVVAAESMTAFGLAGDAYGFAPEALKPTVDREFASGVNLIVPLSPPCQSELRHLPGAI